MNRLLTVLVFCTLIIASAFVGDDALVVVVDAGHGGQDHGAKVDAVNEKQLTNAIAQKIKALRNEDVQVILIRQGDEFVSLKSRVEKINAINPDLLISLHVNQSEIATKHGLEIYTKAMDSDSERAASYVKSIIEHWPQGQPVEEKPGKFMILNEVDCPAILLEMGFLSNADDREFLLSDKGQDQIANAIFQAIEN